MKTMTIDELNKRGLKPGDLYFSENKDENRTGWYLVISDNATVSLNTREIGVWGFPKVRGPQVKKTKVILKEDLEKALWPNNVSTFFRIFDESLVEGIITKIIHKPIAKYIHAVHFGSSNLYTWRVPEKLEKVKFKPGDIIEVDTIYGNQYVQIKETAEYEYDEKTKEVINLIKAVDLPF